MGIQEIRFELVVEKSIPVVITNKPRKFQPGEDWADSPLFTALKSFD
jgi:hypothetical protein